VAFECPEVDGVVLEVAEGDVGASEDVDHEGEIAIGGKERSERMRDDAVADGGEGEGPDRRHLQLPLGRSLRVESLRVLLGRGQGGSERESQPYGLHHRMLPPVSRESSDVRRALSKLHVGFLFNTSRSAVKVSG
jgi:hypothetical protein